MINMKKTLVSVAISTTLLTATSATAALPDPAILNFDAGAKECVLGVDTTTATGCQYDVQTTTGSYFSMDADGSGSVSDSEKTPISNNYGIFVDGITIQLAAGSHSGTPDGSETYDIDVPWSFFGNTGMHQTTLPVSVTGYDTSGNVTLDFAGWSVAWNGIADIPMGGDPDNFASDTGIATLTCAVDCSLTDTFTLSYAAHVPLGDASGFGGVPYTLYLEGTIGSPPTINIDPVAIDNSFTIDRRATGRVYTAPVLGILNNDKDQNGFSDIDKTTVTILAGPTNGTVDINPTTGDITYTPDYDYLSNGVPDAFTYEVTDLGGPEGTGFEITSNVATVTIDVVNAIPVAVNDTVFLNTKNGATSIAVDVIDNDTDSDGTIDPASINITSGPGFGSATIDATTGVITYTPDAGYVGTDSITYTVNDNDGATTNVATAAIIVSNSFVMPENAYLTITAGNTDGNTTAEPADGNGSWFHMEVNPGQLTFVSLSGLNGVSMGVGNKQAGSVAFPDIDSPWSFFGNQGVHQTTSDVLILSDDLAGSVILDLSGWDVSWNNIASIPMNSRAQVAGFNDGLAQVTCTAGGDGVADCSYGDSYILEYSATVPDGDPSGFGGVKYFLHLEGIVSDGVPKVGGGIENAAFDVAEMTAIDANGIDITIAPGSIAGSVGNKTGINLSASDVGVKDPQLNTNDGKQCIGGCIDFVVANVTANYVDLTFKLSEALPAGAVYRKLLNGKWQDFDKSQGDIIGSALSTGGLCQRPEGVFSSGLREGNDCIYMRIYDNGPNDADSTVGTIADPSGALLAGSSNVPAGSSSSGCSISNTDVSLMERADWLIVAGFITWLGLIGYRRNKTLN